MNNQVVEDQSEAYTNQIKVSASASKCFTALTQDIDKWWTDKLEPASAIGESITFHFGSNFKVMKIIEMSESKRVVWEVTDAKIEHPDFSNQKEWIGTKLIWDIEPVGDDTSIVNLTHVGLVPSFQCFELCKGGWEHFFNGSLKGYLESGEGQPFKN